MTDLAHELVAVMLDCHAQSRAGVPNAMAPLREVKKTFRQKNASEQQTLLRALMKAMNQTSQESREQTDGDLLYRAFDIVDELLSVSYERDQGMTSDPQQKERLYEGAGAGVQTCYSSILLALEQAGAKTGAHVVDLGSGYGRVGFVIGLLRPDIHFLGFEFVDHRVQDSNRVAQGANLTNVKFVIQDLADETFRIPEADIFYMYDPFSKETYGSVLNQLIAVGTARPVTIITKGRANTWVADALAGHGWSDTESCDGGTMSLFRSNPTNA